MTFKLKNKILDNKITYTVKSDSYSDNLIYNYTTMRNNVISYLSTVTEGQGDLKNIQDEIEGEFNHLLYRLQQK